MKYVGYATVIVTFAFINTLWSGFVLSLLWSWYDTTGRGRAANPRANRTSDHGIPK